MEVHAASQLGALVRSRRRELGWSQLDLAHRAGVSRKWVGEFEAGKGSVELSLALATLGAVGVRLTTSPAARPEVAGDPVAAEQAVTDWVVDLDALMGGAGPQRPGRS